MIDPKMPLVNAFWSGVHLGLGFNVIFDADGYFSSSILTIFLTAVVAITYLLNEYCEASVISRLSVASTSPHRDTDGLERTNQCRKVPAPGRPSRHT
jgi:hypothetical protein